MAQIGGGKEPPTREPKDPVRLARAETVLAATGEEWAARSGGKLDKAGRDGLRLAVSKAPDLIVDADGEIVGVDAWVQLFDAKGRELPIDPHRRIINPPTVPRAGVRLVDTGKVEQGKPVMDRVLTADPAAAFWECVWDSIESTPNAKGWRTRGTVTTVFSGAFGADGTVLSFDTSSYSNARQHTSGSQLFTDEVTVGQDFFSPEYDCFEGFLSFDTSAINDADTVSAVALDLWLQSDSSTTDFTMEVREHPWGPSLATGDFVAGGSLAAKTLMATLNSSGIGGTAAYKTCASQAAFLTATNLKTGVVAVMLSSSRQRIGNSPSGREYLEFSGSDASGTSQDPKLTITHNGLGSAPFFTSQPNRIWRLG